jgi:hypothetical protein
MVTWGNAMQDQILLRFQSSAVEASGRWSRLLLAGAACFALLTGGLGLIAAKPDGRAPMVAITNL